MHTFEGGMSLVTRENIAGGSSAMSGRAATGALARRAAARLLRMARGSSDAALDPSESAVTPNGAPSLGRLRLI